RGYQVYLPLIDTGIDCLGDVGKGNYKEIQAKPRQDEPTFRARDFKARENFYVICFLRRRRGDDFWVIPSKQFRQLAKLRKTGDRNDLQLSIGGESSAMSNKLAGNHENWGILLSGATREVRRTVESASNR